MKKCIGFILAICFLSIAGYSYIKFNKIPKIEEENCPVVKVILSNQTSFKIQLRPDAAPNTVCNFIDLVECGFYNGLGFSKILPNYLVQTGDTIGNGTGYPGYFIKSECKANGYPNNLLCVQGTVCMARGQKFNTEGSQFFVLLRDAPELNGRYTAFGIVTQGLENLMALTTQSDLTVKQMTVEKFYGAYKEPKVLSMVEIRDTAQ
ncbi:peptidylprolyl isomerase [Cellulosilyticum ruminicola]|uniref:peptidylprolyl isomerase n=1 Tax=Cellulosilyticum ruminicola TaxID=425254 RepID=UPI0006D267A6|nr:peptidylprolyl isomerase [Cellulosilyticum ruminicola]